MHLKKNKILIIGQTPPPHGGQSINIGRMVKVFDQNQIDYRLLRMNFSEEMNENGKFNFKKILKLITLFLKVVSGLLSYRPDYVYYPPSGPEKVPIYRDIILLFFVRSLGFKTVFHFHAGGLSDIYPQLSRFFKSIFRFTFFNPTYSICLSEAGKKDPVFLNSGDITIIPSGVDDIGFKNMPVTENNKLIVLFVGVCRETKGILDFIKVIEMCNSYNQNIMGRIVGKAFSDKEETAIENGVRNGILIYDGVKTGDQKNQIFRESDVFLFPTFFEHENFPTVILEAFSCGLPVISTNWRGVVDQVEDGENGFIHDVHDVEGMSNSVILLFNDVDLRNKLSQNARSNYQECYSLSKFEQNIINYFTTLK